MSINWNNIEEPIRSIANKVAVFVASLSVILVTLNQVVDFLPADVRVKASIVLASVGAVFAVVTKIAGEVGRSQVTPVAKAQGDVAVAQAAALRKP